MGSRPSPRNDDGNRAPEAVRVLPPLAPPAGPLTAAEAAAWLGVHERTVRRAIARGALPAAKLGGVFRIDPADLARFRHGMGDGTADPAAPTGLRLLPGGEGTPDGGPARSFDPSLAALPLPVPLTRFVGRERELAGLAGLLRRPDVRVVTLTGPGGVGKTRLALRAAADAAPRYADGAAFVPLAPLRDPDLVMPTIAQALGADDGPGDPARRLAARLRGRRLLLLLDNLEQVAAAAPAIADLLVACPGVVALVTSRVPLRISGERVAPVGPLPTPDAAPDAEALATLAENDAVRLFLDRAETAVPGFALTPANAADVVAVCRQTDGLPLAIELAAARVRVLSPRDLRERLARRLPVLADGPVDQPRRLRTLRDAIAWSYDLLDPADRGLFRRLAVFAGGFTAAAAGAVEELGGRGVEEKAEPFSSSTPRLVRLLDESLLQRGEGPAGEVRFAMLETIREFGLERLAEAGEEAAARDAHADWCLAFAGRAAPELAGPDHVAWWNRLAAEVDNVRAAHAWLEARGDAGRALRLGEAMSWFWTAAGFLDEGRALFERLAAMPGATDHPALHAAAVHAAGSLSHLMGDLDRARERGEQALAMLRGLGDEAGEVGTLRLLGSIAIDRDDDAAATVLLAEAARRAPAAGATWDAAAIANLQGVVAFARGEYAAAVRFSDEAIAAWRAMGDLGHVGAGLVNLARAALADGRRGPAVAALGEVLGMFDPDVGDDGLVAAAGEVAAGLALAMGRAADAVALIAAASAMHARTGSPPRPGFVRFAADVETAASAMLTPEGADRARTSGKATPIGPLLDAMRAIVAAVGDVERKPRADALTARERDVLRLLVIGRSDKEIADDLGISRNTASNHVAAIREKLGAPTRAAAAARAVRDHLA